MIRCVHDTLGFVIIELIAPGLKGKTEIEHDSNNWLS